MDKSSIKILIVGAGPVCLTAAVELVKRGYSPQIIDLQSSPTPIAQSRALALHAKTLEMFEASGLTQQFLQQG